MPESEALQHWQRRGYRQRYRTQRLTRSSWPSDCDSRNRHMDIYIYSQPRITWHEKDKDTVGLWSVKGRRQ